ncbi:UNVERIFIED_CONTAM: hypothetical protein RMT77_016057 [Armadillidium vulgare]
MNAKSSLSNLGVLGLSKRYIIKNNISNNRIYGKESYKQETDEPSEEVMNPPSGKNLIPFDLEVNSLSIFNGNPKTKGTSSMANEMKILGGKHNLRMKSIKVISRKIKSPYEPVPYLDRLTSEEAKTLTGSKSQNITEEEVITSRSVENGNRTPCSRNVENGHKNPCSRNVENGHKNPCSRNVENGHRTPCSRNVENGNRTTCYQNGENGNRIPSSRNVENGHKTPCSRNVENGHKTPCSRNGENGHRPPSSRNVENGNRTTCSTSSKNTREYWYLNKTTATILIIQSIYGVLYTAFIRYSAEADGSEMRNSIHPVRGGFTHEDLSSKTAEMFLPFLYIYILLTSKDSFETMRETRSSLGNFSLLFSLGLEWTLLLLAFFKEDKIRFTISIESIVETECLMVSFTICYLMLRRKISLLQLILLQIIHIQVQILTKYVLENHFKVNDSGMTMLSHVFGSLFGLSASFPLDRRSEPKISKKRRYSSISVPLLLMVILPSLAYVRTSDDAKRRVVIHSVLVMTSSFVIGLPTSSIFNKNRKYSLRKILDGLIGASAAIGSVSHLMFDVYGSIFVGLCTTIITIALISALENKYPDIEEQNFFGLFIRHGLNGIIGGLLSSLLSILASSDIGYYGYSLFKIYPVRTPTEGSNELLEVQSYLPIPAGEGRTAFEQGGFQLAGLVVVLLSASVGGALSGFLLRFKLFEGFLEEDFDEEEEEYSSQGRFLPFNNNNNNSNNNINN